VAIKVRIHEIQDKELRVQIRLHSGVTENVRFPQWTATIRSHFPPS